MAINIEKLYEKACVALRYACIHLWGEEDGEKFYEKVTAEPELWLKSDYIGDVTAPLEIWHMAHEELSFAKGGTRYSALKRFIKGCNQKQLQGWWLENGKQCFCDGYRAVRLKKMVDGLPEAKYPGVYLEDIYPKEPYPTAIKLPTPGELKISMSEWAASHRRDERPLYDFGDGLPLVNAKYLKDMMDILPDAKATCDGMVKPIVFKSKDGDGLLLPVRKL